MTEEPQWTPYSMSQQSGHQGEGSEAAEPQRRAFIEVARDALGRAGYAGLTWRELANRFDLHHGQASSALSNLHRTGGAVRLQDRRNGSGVYVTPGNVHGRAVVAHRSQEKGVSTEQVHAIIDEWASQRNIHAILYDEEIADLKGRF